MDRDIRTTGVYRDTEHHFRSLLEPGFGRPTGATEPSLHPTEDRIAFTATVFEELDGRGASRVAIADADGVRLATHGPNDDRCPRWSPDGQTLAFLADRDRAGDFQVHLLRAGVVGEAQAAAVVAGTVEYLSWSPDGTRLLLGVAGHGADRAGGHGSGTLAGGPQDVPAWMPEVINRVDEREWRSLWVLDVAGQAVRRLTRSDLNPWEAVWCGDRAVLAVCNDGDPKEGAWYTADLRLIDVDTDTDRVLWTSDVQMGWPAATPAGDRVAVVEAHCSDRWIVAGDVRLIDPVTGGVEAIDTLGVDVTQLQWLDGRRLAYCGQRHLDSVIGLYDLAAGKAQDVWVSFESIGNRYPEASVRRDGTAGVVLDSYSRPFELAIVRGGELQTVASLAHAGTGYLLSVAGRIEPVTWTAPDGLEIEGLLALPDGEGPFPLVVHVHGGPVWAFRNRWQMGYPYTPLLVRRGYAVLHPNPRGSSGRGQEFIRHVVGDMCGADTYDYLAGVDALVERGIADPDRIGVMGGSYGGHMSSWLITQDQRFAAAVPISPVTDSYSQHYLSNIPEFDELFLNGPARTPDGKHFHRSPVFFAEHVRTPTLQFTGALDRCTPPTQAVEFHNAIRQTTDVETVCVVYPAEGHGVRTYPALIDMCARTVEWFGRHMPATR